MTDSLCEICLHQDEALEYSHGGKVLEDLRTPERQKVLMEAGASQTLNSRHITGHAVDLGAWVGNMAGINKEII